MANFAHLRCSRCNFGVAEPFELTPALRCIRFGRWLAHEDSLHQFSNDLLGT